MCSRVHGLFNIKQSSFTPGAPLTYFNDGGSGRGSYFTPKIITTSEFAYPKKSLLYLAYPKKSLIPFFATPKISLFFYSRPKKVPGVFHRPQKITFGQNFRPKKITRTPPPPPSLKYVSGAPGSFTHSFRRLLCFQ